MAMIEKIFTSTDELMELTDEGSSFYKAGFEISKRKSLVCAVLAFRDVVYVASTGVDDDKLELIGRAIRANEYDWNRASYELYVVREKLVKRRNYYPKEFLKVYRDWLKKFADGQTKIFRWWWD
jgi:hypothetical protein